MSDKQYHPLILQSSVPPFFGAAFGFSQRLTAGADPGNFRGSTPSTLFFTRPFSMLLFDPLSSSIFNPTRPHLGPHVGPYKPIFCPSFSDHHSNSISDLILDRFRTPNRPQNRSKIDQKCLPKSSYKQALFQLHLRSNFEDNLMFKQNGRFSKIVPKRSVFACFLDIRSCQPKQTRDMQRIETSSKTISKNQ